MAVSLVGIGVISCVPCFSHFFSLLELQDYRGRFFGHLCWCLVWVSADGNGGIVVAWYLWNFGNRHLRISL